MKRAAVVLLLMCLACESQRDGRRCIGINGDKEPGVRYEPSIRNIVLGVIFVETIFVPLVVALAEFSCPVSAEPAREGSARPPDPGSKP